MLPVLRYSKKAGFPDLKSPHEVVNIPTPIFSGTLSPEESVLVPCPSVLLEADHHIVDYEVIYICGSYAPDGHLVLPFEH